MYQLSRFESRLSHNRLGQMMLHLRKLQNANLTNTFCKQLICSWCTSTLLLTYLGKVAP